MESFKVEEIVYYSGLSRLTYYGYDFLNILDRPARKKDGPLPIQFIWEAAGGGRSPRHGAIDSHSCLAPIGEATAKVLARLSSKARQAAVRRSA